MEYEKAIQEKQDGKRHLYEQFVSGEIDGGEYKIQKQQLDAELDNIKRLYSSVSTEVKQSKAARDESGKITAIVAEVDTADSLTRSLVEALIDKVYVYPGQNIEIIWRFDGF